MAVAPPQRQRASWGLPILGVLLLAPLGAALGMVYFWRRGYPARAMWLLAGGIFYSMALMIAIGAVGAGASGSLTSSAPFAVPASPSLPALEATIKSEVVAKFNPAGLATVSCIMPKSWGSGATFTCYGYNVADSQVGVAQGTVLTPNKGYASSWNLEWVPTG